MYSVTSASAQWDLFTGKNKDVAGVGDDAFSRIFGSSLKNVFGGDSAIQGILDSLAQRFPNATVREGEVGAGVKGTEEFFGEEEGDQVAVETSALAAMSNSADLFKTIENAISSFLEGTSASASQGSYVQRSVSITITTIRFSVAQRDAGTGELQSSSELKTALQEKLQELINKFFGVSPAEDTDTDADAAEETEKVAETEKSSDKQAGGYQFGGIMWSMELYYSASYIQGMSQNGSSGSGMSAQSWQFSASFSQLTNSFIPGAIGQWAGGNEGGSSGSGPFSSLFDGLLSGFGIASDGVTQGMGGYMMRLRESRNLMAELMELYGSRIQPKTPVEETEATEDVGAVEDASGTEAAVPAAEAPAAAE